MINPSSTTVEAMRTLQRVLMATAILAVTMSTTGCLTGRSAEEIATSGARDRARAAAKAVEGSLRADKNPTGETLLNSQADHVSGSPHNGAVFDKALEPGGGIRLDVSFVHKGDANHDQMTVRLCVRITGQPGPSAKVALTDTPCWAGAGNDGTVDKTIHLDD